GFADLCLTTWLRRQNTKYTSQQQVFYHIFDRGQVLQKKHEASGISSLNNKKSKIYRKNDSIQSAD
ncbi:MAG: hypothetical protein KDJ65_31250, partial [Anaerolineae bacterium]|nr:hypothetical protein [Anaerolineae bacterium]